MQKLAGLLFVFFVALQSHAHAQDKSMLTVAEVQLDRYLGVWYEIARKPMYFENKCVKNVTASYTLNENGNVVVENRCDGEDHQVYRAIGEAFVVNPPANTKFKVSFLPEVLRWMPIGRGDYWVLKLDDQYQTVLVGEPSRQYLWILARTPQISAETLNEYLCFAQRLGYQTDDLIRTQQNEK
ncbi:lipocalin family protein [Acinetobacter sp. MD2]|uniref:lipocalin family protein n=1 Tax=Acinetobacter sp. MD2 TaxID=2600066 RepID=UPI002D795813|nr:lipocalin family protein [Acinetobacter sp. MD2]